MTTERILSKEQTAEMGYLQRVLGVTLRDKKHRSEIRIERSQSRYPNYVSSAMHPECPRKEWRTKSFKLQSNVHWRLVYLVYDGFLYCFCLLAESHEIIKHYHSTPTEKWSRVRPRTTLCNYISDLAWSRLGVERAELSEFAVDREEFRVHLGLLLSPLSPKEKRTRKWVDE